jgi:hypothetical protein
VYKRWVVDTGTNGNRNADIVVGEPVDMAVELLDEATGRPIEDASVRAEGDARWWGGGGLGSAWNAKTKRYEFRVPAGKVEVYVDGWYSTVGDATFDVSPNQREFVVRARRDFGIDLILVSGAARIPWADETRLLVSVERLDKQAAVSGTGVGPDSALRLALREPGTYQVTIPDQPGFEPVLPFEVAVRTGEFTRHEVRLLPKR